MTSSEPTLKLVMKAQLPVSYPFDYSLYSFGNKRGNRMTDGEFARITDPYLFSMYLCLV